MDFTLVIEKSFMFVFARAATEHDGLSVPVHISRVRVMDGAHCTWLEMVKDSFWGAVRIFPAARAYTGHYFYLNGNIM